MNRLRAAKRYGVVADDHGRDETLTGAGYTVLRFPDRDVYGRRHDVRAQVAAALAGGGRP